MPYAARCPEFNDAMHRFSAQRRNVTRVIDLSKLISFSVMIEQANEWLNSITFELWEARSWLYRCRFWKNTRWTALDEVYKICILLHRSDLKCSAEIRPKKVNKCCHLYTQCWLINNIVGLSRICSENKYVNICRMFATFRKSNKLVKLLVILYSLVNILIQSAPYSGRATES